MKKKIIKYATGLGVGTIGLGVGSQVLGDIGGDVAAKGQTGLSNVAKFAPAAGTILGGGLMLGAMNELGKKYKTRK